MNTVTAWVFSRFYELILTYPQFPTWLVLCLSNIDGETPPYHLAFSPALLGAKIYDGTRLWYFLIWCLFHLRNILRYFGKLCARTFRNVGKKSLTSWSSRHLRHRARLLFALPIYLNKYGGQEIVVWNTISVAGLLEVGLSLKGVSAMCFHNTIFNW